jgi:valyl-tRNA synthetase
MMGYRAFANKVWNAARFTILNLDESEPPVEAEEVDALLEQGLPLEDRWILARLDELAAEISDSLEKFRFHEASSAIYQFFWHELCDWYIELVKPVLTDRSRSVDRARRVRVLVHILDYALRILHPFMPFLTEEIWQKIPHTGESIMVQEFPRARAGRRDAEAVAEMRSLMDLIGAIRTARSERGIEPRKQLKAFLKAADADARRRIERNLDKVQHVARLEAPELVAEFPAERLLLKGVSQTAEFGLDLAGAIDVGAERERLSKESARVKQELEKIGKKLASQDFLSRAPEAVVAENRMRHAELLEKLAKLQSNLGQLPG